MFYSCLPICQDRLVFIVVIGTCFIAVAAEDSCSLSGHIKVSMIAYDLGLSQVRVSSNKPPPQLSASLEHATPLLHEIHDEEGSESDWDAYGIVWLTIRWRVGHWPTVISKQRNFLTLQASIFSRSILVSWAAFTQSPWVRSKVWVGRCSNYSVIGNATW